VELPLGVLAILGVALGVIAIALAMPSFGFWIQSVIRWRRRRDPLRIEVGPNAHRDDAIFVTITTVGFEPLPLAVMAFRSSDGTEGWGPKIQRETVEPASDGLILLVKRDEMPVLAPSARWESVWVKDQDDHERREPIPPELAARVARRPDDPPSPSID
jgi:hypothetical protein